MSRVYEALNRLPKSRSADGSHPAGPEAGRADHGSHPGDPGHSGPAETWALRSYPEERVGIPEPGRTLRARVAEPVQERPAPSAAPVRRPWPVRQAEGPEAAVAPRPETLVISAEAPTSLIDSYRKLATTLLDIQARSTWKGSAPERGLKTLLVTSARAREGKTLTAVNLALTLSEVERKRVLLIDADLRRPSIHALLDVSNRSGLADALQSPDVVLPLRAYSPTLSVLPAGRPGAAGVANLTSEAMRAVLERCASEFDWILVDAPPVSALSHPERLARFSRSVLFVIGSGVTPYLEVSRSIAQLGHGSIVGTVLNKVE